MMTPIIMEADILEVEKKLAILHERKVERVHIDIGDGLFSEMLSITPADLYEIELPPIKIDIHLLVDDPQEWIEECTTIKPERVIGQIERMGNQELFLETVSGYGIEGGLALKIETPIEAIEPESLLTCKTILLLAVPAGTSGSEFDVRVLDKIVELRKIYTGSILVDGAINMQTHERVVAVGASETGSNSAYWKGGGNG